MNTVNAPQVVEQHEPVRILVVEDDGLQASILKSVLTGAGFQVDTIPGGLVTVWMVREGHYDVVIVDYQLPEINGLTVANLISEFMGSIARPILIAHTISPDKLNAEEAGLATAFDIIVEKSADFSSLVATINNHLASAPDRATKQEFKSLLLLKDWLDYDAQPIRPAGQHAEPYQTRILIVEDDGVQQLLLASVLQKHGYLIETSCSGLDAVRKIRQTSYDLVLIDYSLPEMDGLAIGCLIRDIMQEAVRPRLIALTATPERLKDREGFSLSVFDEILQKTPDWAELIRSIDHHLRSSSNQDTRRAAEYKNFKSESV